MWLKSAMLATGDTIEVEDLVISKIYIYALSTSILFDKGYVSKDLKK